MKTHVLIMAIALMTILPFSQSVAQTSYSSKREILSGINSAQELSCEFLSRYIVSHSQSNSSFIQHYFTIQDMDTTFIRISRFSLNLGSNPGGNSILPAVKFVVHDMKVSDNRICYFCGTRKEEYSFGNQPDDSIGFIGMFPFDDVWNGTGTCKILLINGTSKLTRIEPRGSYEQVFAVGLTNSVGINPIKTNLISCLVGLEYDYSTFNWYYDMVIPQSSTEQFTDVANSGHGIITSSRYIGDNYHIGLRHVKNGPLSSGEYTSMLNNCNKYDMQTATTGGNVVACRKDNDPILLSSQNEYVTMAHSCYNVANGIATYLLQAVNNGNAQLVDAQYTSAPSYVSLKDIAVCIDGLKSFFLTTDNTGTSHISQTDWSTTGTYIYSEIPVNSTDIACMRLERFFRNSWEYYYIGGLTSSSQPAFYAQRLFASNSFFVISCLPSSSYKSFIPLQTPIYTSTSPGLIEIVCQINHQLVTDTTSHSFTSTSVTPNTTCNH